MNVRPATPEDAASIARLFVASAEHHRALDPVLYRVVDPEVIENIYASGGPHGAGMEDRATTLVAELDGVVAGFVDVEIAPPPRPPTMLRDSTSAYVRGIAVDDARRGSGIGRALLEAAEAWARAHGAGFIELDAHADNKDALRFYEQRAGYRPVGAILMKPLD